jgi:hypothetical protein
MSNNKKQTEINAVEYLGKVNQFAEVNSCKPAKQQTAIEWLFDNVYMAHSELSEKLNQAKEMEKEQMIEFGELCWKNLLRSDVIMRPRDVYNETYGGNK